MPWVFTEGRGGRSRRTSVNRSTRRQFRNGAARDYDDRDEYQPEGDRDDDYDDHYDQPESIRDRRPGRLIDLGDGTSVRVVVQSPRDLLPPMARPGDFANTRRRARF